MTGAQVEVEVDAQTCVGSSWCTTIAGRAFVIGTDGKAHVADIEDTSLDDLQEAEDSCPVSAIRVLARTNNEGTR